MLIKQTFLHMKKPTSGLYLRVYFRFVNRAKFFLFYRSFKIINVLKITSMSKVRKRESDHVKIRFLSHFSTISQRLTTVNTENYLKEFDTERFCVDRKRLLTVPIFFC